MRALQTIVIRLAGVVACVVCSVSMAAAQVTYVKVAEIPIGGAGAFDYLNVDSAAKRLYVTHGTEIVVIDMTTNKVVGRIADTPRVHGIAIVPELGRAFTSNGGENKVSVVDLKTLATLSKIETGANPDAIAYDASKKEIYTFNGAKAGGYNATVIDAAKGSVVATIDLGDKPESGVVDPAMGRVFVNLENKNMVAAIDTATHTKVAEWPISPADGPTGMAIDTAAKRLFVGGDKLALVDYTTGKVVTSVTICEGTDATWYDAANKLVLNSCGDGHITITRFDAPDKLTVVSTLATTRGARTMAFDPATRRIYTAAVNYEAPAAGAAAGARPTAVADSFHVLVFDVKH
jgi:YVTN family beta-propeller protein